MSLHVYTQAYCGMTLPHGEYDSEADARERVQRRIAFAEKFGAEVIQLDPQTWEICEPDDCMLVPDWCGVLHMRADPPHIH